MEIATAVKIIDKCIMPFLRLKFYTIKSTVFFFSNMDLVELRLLWHLFMTDTHIGGLYSGSILKSDEKPIVRQNSLIPGLCKCYIDNVPFCDLKLKWV